MLFVSLWSNPGVGNTMCLGHLIDDVGRYGVRRRVDGSRATSRESHGGLTNTCPISQEVRDTARVNSGRSGASPPGFDLSEFST